MVVVTITSFSLLIIIIIISFLIFSIFLLLFLCRIFGEIFSKNLLRLLGLCCCNCCLLIITIPIIVILLLILLVFSIMYASGSTGFAAIFTIYSFIWNTFLAIVTLLNTFNKTLPNTLSYTNIIWKGILSLAKQTLDLFCGAEIVQKEGFNVFVDCPNVVGFTTFVIGLPALILNVIQSIIFFWTEIIPQGFKPGVCDFEIDCDHMCFDLKQNPYCPQGMDNYVEWFFGTGEGNGDWRVVNLVCNLVDHQFVGIGSSIIQYFAKIGYVNSLVIHCIDPDCAIDDYNPSTCNITTCFPVVGLYQIFNRFFNSVNNELILRYFLSLLVQIIVSPIQTILCRIVNCLWPLLCGFVKSILATIPLFPAYLIVCPGSSSCVCSKNGCDDAWTFLLGQGQCTLSPTCIGCVPGVLLNDFVGYIRGLGRSFSPQFNEYYFRFSQFMDGKIRNGEEFYHNITLPSVANNITGPSSILFILLILFHNLIIEIF